MANKKLIEQTLNELPSHYADRLGVNYAKSVNQEHKKAKGQFFTPVEIAGLMGTFTENDASIIRVLDPGCGTAILTCALLERLIDKNKNLEKVDLVVYETDSELISYTNKSLDYLQKWLGQQKISLQYSIHTNDFILENADCLTDSGNLFSTSTEPFDIIISNPPYFKLPVDDKRAIAAKSVVNGHPNIYAIFMAISARLLKKNGELIFITPRSYASGSYFKLFREYFFRIIEMDNVHLFVSRKDTFNRDKVLQETVIIKGTRKEKTNPRHNVILSSSQGLKDIANPEVKSFKQKELIDLSSNEKILYLPTSDFDESILAVFKNWNGNLNKYNIQISTGPVVAFRSRNYIQENFENGTVFLAPLFWLHNVKQMTLEWPIFKPEKGQYMRIENEAKAILIANKNYILLRRFSTKDDKSRLIAAPYFCNFIKSDYIGVENKVNYIYRPKGHLDRNEVIGLCALLNSTLFDSYFRIFNGNVNVSATELREIPLPKLNEIKAIGDQLISVNNYSKEYANSVVNELFNIEEMIAYEKS
jgi:adenine-specific DNA-methyltransferase